MARWKGREGVEQKEEDVGNSRKNKTGRGRKDEGAWTVEHRIFTRDKKGGEKYVGVR
jgi:hypothetical protein